MLGQFIKQTRESRRLSQNELARLAGVSSAHISRIEKGTYISLSVRTLNKLSKALKVPFNDLRALITGKDVNIHVPVMSIRAAFTEFQTNSIEVPIIADMHAPGRIMEYLYIPKPQSGHKNFYGVKIRGDCLSPKAEDGDIVIIDKDDVPEFGKTVLCYHNGNDEPQIIKIKKKSDVTDCELYGVILWIMKKP